MFVSFARHGLGSAMPKDLFHVSTRSRRRLPLGLVTAGTFLVSSAICPAQTLSAWDDDAEGRSEVVALSRLVVTEARDNSAPPTLNAASETLGQTAGAVALIDLGKAEQGRVGTSADILAFTPGIFAAPPAGSGDGIKLSIRGSAIARSAGNFFRSGTLFTFDGLPVTGPGGTPYELFETYGLNYTEVLLGGNAFDYGALQLGGAINYVTKTGYDAAPLEARVEAGSFGYRKYQLASGRVQGQTDYFLSFAASEVDGYQLNSQGRSEGFAGNLGLRLTPTITTRFFLRYRRTENESPGNVSLLQLRSNPRGANPDNVVGRVNRVQPGSTWIANRTDFNLGEGRSLRLGFVFHDAPIDIAPNASPGTATNPAADRERSLWNFRDATVSATYTHAGELFGRAARTSLALLATEEFFADVNTFANNPNVTTGPRAFRNLLKTANYDGSKDSSLRLIQELDLTDTLTLSGGASLAYIRRASEVTYSFLNTYSRYERDDLYFAPRVGFTFDLKPNVTVFGNVTRSIEPPNSWQLNRGSNGSFFAHDELQDQTAWAYEVGARAQAGALTASLSVFHTDVEEELLSVPLVPGNPAAGSRTFNGSETLKQGVELALDAVLWTPLGWLPSAPSTGETRVVLSQSYSYNDFSYKNDPTFGRNELPGVPRQYYQARLDLEHRSGFYASVSALHASAYFLDFANTLETPSYTLYGASLGYTHPVHRWQIFVDARNLTDETYASSAGPTFLAGATETARLNSPQYQVGDGFSLTAGVTLRF